MLLFPLKAMLAIACAFVAVPLFPFIIVYAFCCMPGSQRDKYSQKSLEREQKRREDNARKQVRRSGTNDVAILGAELGVGAAAFGAGYHSQDASGPDIPASLEGVDIDVGAALSSGANAAGDALAAAGSAARDVGGDIEQGLGGVAGAVRDSGAIESAGAVAESAVDGALALGAGAADLAGNAAQGAGAAASDAAAAATGALEGAGGVAGIAETLASSVHLVGRNIGSVFAQLGESVGAAAGMVGTAAGGVVEGAGDLVANAGDAVGGVLKVVVDGAGNIVGAVEMPDIDAGAAVT